MPRRDRAPPIAPGCCCRPRGAAFSGFHSVCIVSAALEVVGAFGGCEQVDEASDGVPEGADGLGGLAQERLEFREGLLEWIEVGAVGRQEAQLCAGRLDQGLDARALGSVDSRPSTH